MTGSNISATRSLEEIKSDIHSRIARRAPFLHADKDESEEALRKLTSVEPQRWAEAWSVLGARDGSRPRRAVGHAGLPEGLRLLRHRAPTSSARRLSRH